MNGAAIGAGVTSGILTIVAAWFYFRHRKDSKLTIVLFGLVGMVGVGTFWAGISTAVHNTEVSIAGGAGGALGGSAAGILIGIAIVMCLEIFWKALHKSGKPKTWHPWVALFLGIVMSASGVGIFTSFRDTITSITTQVGQDTMGTGGGPAK